MIDSNYQKMINDYRQWFFSNFNTIEKIYVGSNMTTYDILLEPFKAAWKLKQKEIDTIYG
jgi:hypothetical protein